VQYSALTHALTITASLHIWTECSSQTVATGA